MNKIIKNTMMAMGAGMMMGAAYYMGLPKNKKDDLKNKATKMINADKNFMKELS